jgi:hypothetical protein
VTAESYFAGHTLSRATFDRVRAVLDELGTYEVRVTKSQVAFRRRRGFAYLWMPGRYLEHPQAEVVLSITLLRHDTSPRFKEVVHPTSWQWLHHLEVQSLDDLDAQVEGWLAEAYDAAG